MVVCPADVYQQRKRRRGLPIQLRTRRALHRGAERGRHVRRRRLPALQGSTQCSGRARESQSWVWHGQDVPRLGKDGVLGQGTYCVLARGQVGRNGGQV